MNALEVIGILGLVYLGCRVSLQACKCLYVYFIRAARRRGAIQKEKGRWACEYLYFRLSAYLTCGGVPGPSKLRGARDTRFFPDIFSCLEFIGIFSATLEFFPDVLDFFPVFFIVPDFFTAV